MTVWEIGVSTYGRVSASRAMKPKGSYLCQRLQAGAVIFLQQGACVQGAAIYATKFRIVSKPRPLCGLVGATCAPSDSLLESSSSTF